MSKAVRNENAEAGKEGRNENLELGETAHKQEDVAEEAREIIHGEGKEGKEADNETRRETSEDPRKGTRKVAEAHEEASQKSKEPEKSSRGAHKETDREGEQGEEPHGTRSGPEEKRLQGHWLLAKMGKRVLRPGGIELTRRVIKAAKPSAKDRIVEFGPGVGRTAEILLAAQPKEYVGVDPNKEGTPQLLQVISKHGHARLQEADAKATGLPGGSADLVVGEAMLTMQSDEDKLVIMREAFRVLAPGGRYAIHELGFCPDDVPENVVHEVSRALSRTIKVGARPLTSASWKQLLEEAGFEVEYSDSNPMQLLEPKRLIADEGFFGAVKFFFNVVRNKAARDRIKAMRRVFRTHKENIDAVGFVARKP